MASMRAFATVVLAAGTALAFSGLPAAAQSTPPPPAKVKRDKVDVREMVPGPQASDPAGDAPPAGGLTRDQRKEATLQARQEGTLQPAGDTAEPREAKPALASGNGAARPAVADPAPAARAEATPLAEASRAAEASTAATVATAASAAATAKKTRKKPRGASGSTPA